MRNSFKQLLSKPMSTPRDGRAQLTENKLMTPAVRQALSTNPLFQARAQAALSEQRLQQLAKDLAIEGASWPQL